MIFITKGGGVVGHIHSIYDADKHFIIDPITRVITALSEKLTLIVNDHNSERYTFEIPRYIEGHDMSLCNKVEIHYDNISKDKRTTNHDFYTVTDMKVSEDDETIVVFSWLISESATQFVGKLQFSIHFECISDEAIREYAWNTYYFKDVKISDGVNNTEHVLVEHSDFVNRMETLVEGAIKKRPKAIMIDLPSSDWQGDGQICYQSVEVESVTANSQIDLRPSPEQLHELLVSELSLTAANDNATVTVFAIGGKPTSDYRMQIIVTEVDVV